jgi:NAD-dependent DNA ligase
LETKSITSQFDEIEKRVERLMTALNALEEANLQLKNKNRKLEEELQAKVEAEARYQQERESIREKIDGLLMKLENISEASL